MPAAPLQDILLIGGGHSHVQVLRRQLMRPLPGARVTMVVDRPVAAYSGMVPGVVAGQYAPHEVDIDLRPLARKAGARFIVAAVTRIDAEARRVYVEGRPPIAYDLASINVGSTVAGKDLPGVRAHAVPTRPIGRFVERVEGLLSQPRSAPLHLVVVGAGAGGVELAFCARERLLRAGAAEVHTTLLDAGERVLAGASANLAAKVEAAAAARGIRIRHHTRVQAVEAEAVVLEGGERLPSQLTLWVTGAEAFPFLAASGLPTERGFVKVGPTLQVLGHPELFAVGDCNQLTHAPRTPKAGVYAVREGPYLADNLALALTGRPLREYRPQTDFLALLNLGDGRAIGAKWGLAFEGAALFRLKDRIDRAFMEKFQVLDVGGAEAEGFARGMPPMEQMEMVCGGCAAKVGASALSRALSRLPPVQDPEVVMGLDAADDAAAVQRPGEVAVHNVDAFPAFTDDPWLVGRVAALNALSDLHACGVAPKHAMALVTIPEDSEPEEALYQVLSGAREALDADGVTLLGGHTTVGPSLHVGFSVTGYARDAAQLWRNAALRPGDALVLTRGLGTGVLFHADMAGRATGAEVQAALARMLRGNGPAAQVARARGVTGVTDVTGFGLAGHLGEMLRGAGLSAELELAAVPALPGAERLIRAGERSTFHAQNREALKALYVPERLGQEPKLELLFDPQTAGGLLLGVAAGEAEGLVAALREAGELDAAVIGRVTETREDGALFGVG
ncbi:MAG: selenide, water dikinase SelD [Alphaproteobacteria bacterium]|nr:selenide, water dikinase SelD [Alphaproteobacteria bacterium]